MLEVQHEEVSMIHSKQNNMDPVQWNQELHQSLKTIQHDTAVILLHQISDLTFVLIAATETIQLRLALREFAKITTIIFEKVPESRLLAQDDPSVYQFVQTYFRV